MTGGGAPADGQRVAVVTGGGGGIGAAIAEELGRRGTFVVTLDPLVSLDGSEALPAPEETTAGRIVAAGGSARASSASVTDTDAVRSLFEELGRVDAVVNVAGITRPTSFTRGTEEDWAAVLDVHLGGYLNILGAALPVMAAAGHGRILGVTSGSGWRPADTGAYGCAKRAVAALTWDLGRQVPPGVVLNAVSPIAVTRMVTAALERSRAAAPSPGPSRGSSTGGLSLGSMPAPAELGPLGAHLVGERFDACRGRVLFSGGSEVALIDPPRLLEVVRDDGPASLAHVLEAVTAGALVPAERDQVSGGGSNPRFTAAFSDAPEPLPRPAVATCAVVADRPDLGAAVARALEARGVTTTAVGPAGPGPAFAGAADGLAAAAAGTGPLDAVVVALAARPPAAASTGEWGRVLDEHAGVADGILADAAWARAVADHAVQAGRPVRLVALSDGTTAGGRSRGQAVAQLARSARGATEERVTMFPVSVESDDLRPVADLAAHLLCSPDSTGLSGAELVVGSGWVGLRSHPRPAGSITLGGPTVPDWFDDTVREIAGGST